MRIASKTVYEMVKFRLGTITEEMYKANEVIASGKRINKPSDDPVGMIQSLQLKSELSSIEQFQRNITLGTSWLMSAESVLRQAQNLISDTKVLCIQMANSTTGAEERKAATQQVQNMREEIITLANTQITGRYLFAGSNSDAAPFDQDGVYQGDSNAFTIKIGKDSTLEIGSDGEDVFGDIFNTLQDLNDALDGNNVGVVQESITLLDNHFDDISVKISGAGSKMVRLETRNYIFEDSRLTDIERLSNIQDADIAEAIIDLESIGFTYQAALASSAEVMKLSLVDYLS